jgi:hypothetical protein
MGTASLPITLAVALLLVLPGAFRPSARGWLIAIWRRWRCAWACWPCRP